MSRTTIVRLQRELQAISKDPPPLIRTKPMENDILIWHYVIEGAPDTPYAGGFYHGTLTLPHEYPLKPPAVKMITPNGRFKTNERLCMSMSDYHPETWQPTWGIDKILLGLQSFMNGTESTLGSMESSDAEKKKFAAKSLDFNCENATFRKLFPELVELREKRAAEMERILADAKARRSAVTGAGGGSGVGSSTSSSSSSAAAAAAAADGASITAQGNSSSSGANAAAINGKANDSSSSSCWLLVGLLLVIAILAWYRKGQRNAFDGEF